MKGNRPLLGAMLVLLALVAAPRSAQEQAPAQVYGELFSAVQPMGIFPDGKTFVDAALKRAPEAIMAKYSRRAPQAPEELRMFVFALRTADL